MSFTFELVDLGIESPHYFQGFGTFGTEYTDSCYGIGDNPRDAANDALEQACCGTDMPPLMIAAIEAEITAIPTTPDVYDRYPENECIEMFYHIGLRWRIDVDPEQEE